MNEEISDDAFDRLRTELEQEGQSHLFDALDEEQDEDVRLRFASQLLKLNSTTPGGLRDYCARGRRLLGRTTPVSLADLAPPPLGDVLKSNSPAFEECEELGLAEMPATAFVLVAGGLGERLGFPKTRLETDLLTHTNILRFHCECVLAVQTRAREISRNDALCTPFAIMTSESNHTVVLDALSKLDAECASQLNITLLKQSEVACFENTSGRLALRPDALLLVTKPHGHGDVHELLFRTKMASSWTAARHLVFFQDTNLVGFRSVCAALGNSVRRAMDSNFVCVERSNGYEPMGLICANKQGRTVSVEYNLLEAEREYGSAFPGNINLLVFNLDSYVAAVEKCNGLCPEFVNPKFKSGSTTEFNSPSRLECLMQDLPLPASARVGFTQMERFLAYSPMKNNAQDAFTRFQQTGFAASPSAAESDLFHTNRLLLAMCGVQVRTSGLPLRRFLNIPFEEGARVALHPSFGLTVAELRSRFPTPHLVSLSPTSALVLEGDVVVYALQLDGQLTLRARGEGSRLVVRELHVSNAGSELEALGDDAEVAATPNESIRGFRLRENESLVIACTSGSEVVVDRPRG